MLVKVLASSPQGNHSQTFKALQHHFSGFYICEATKHKSHLFYIASYTMHT